MTYYLGKSYYLSINILLWFDMDSTVVENEHSVLIFYTSLVIYDSSPLEFNNAECPVVPFSMFYSFYQDLLQCCFLNNILRHLEAIFCKPREMIIHAL